MLLERVSTVITAGSQEEEMLEKPLKKALCPPGAKAGHSGAVLSFIHHDPQVPGLSQSQLSFML